MSASEPEGGGKQEMNDSGCVQDGSPPKSQVMENGYTGQAQLLDLSDDVLLYILRNLSPQDLKALGFTCARLGSLVLERSLWVTVDARGVSTNRARMHWLIQALHEGTRALLLTGHAEEARGCRGHVNRTRTDEEKDGDRPPIRDVRDLIREQAARDCVQDRRINGNNNNDLPHEVPPVDANGNEEAPEPPFPLVRQQARLHINAHQQLPRQSSSPSWPEDCEWDEPEAEMIQEESSEDTAGCPGPIFTMSALMMKEITEKCPRLTSLSLEYCNINCNKVNPSNFPPSIKKLSLRGTRCYNPPLDKSYLFRIHDYMPALEYLDLSECAWLEPAALLPLSKLVNLRVLLMRDCPALAEFVAYVSLATRYGFRALKILDLRGSPVGDSEVSALGWLPQLHELYLSAPLGPSAPASPSPHHHYIGDPLPRHPNMEPWELQLPEYYRAREVDWTSPETSIEDVEAQAQLLRDTFARTPAPLCIEVRTRLRDPRDAPEIRLRHELPTWLLRRPAHGIEQFLLPPEGEPARDQQAGPSNQPSRSSDGHPSKLPGEEPSTSQAGSSKESSPSTSQITQQSKISDDLSESESEPPKSSQEEVVETLQEDEPIKPPEEKEPDKLPQRDEGGTQKRLNSQIDPEVGPSKRYKEDEEEKKKNGIKNDTQKRSYGSQLDPEAGPSKRYKEDVEEKKNNEIKDTYTKDNPETSDTSPEKLPKTVNKYRIFKHKNRLLEDQNNEEKNNKQPDSTTPNLPGPSNAVTEKDSQHGSNSNSDDDENKKDAAKKNSARKLSNKKGRPVDRKNVNEDVNSGASTSKWTPQNQINHEYEPPAKKSRKPESSDEESSVEESSSEEQSNTEKTSDDELSSTKPRRRAKSEGYVSSSRNGDCSDNEESSDYDRQEPDSTEPDQNQDDEQEGEDTEEEVYQQEPEADHQEEETDHQEQNNEPEEQNNHQQYIRFRRNQPPVVIRAAIRRRRAQSEQPEQSEQSPREAEPACQGGQPGQRQERQQVQEQAEPRHHVLYVNLGQQLHAVYRLLPNRQFQQPQNRYTPVEHVDSSSLVSDSSIRRFGRADGEDINIVHIGPNGPQFGGRDNSGRPNRSSLRLLSATGFRNITNRSLVHLATAAPHLEAVDFTDTGVTAEGVEAFKTLRPDVEIKFSHIKVDEEVE